MENSFLNDLKLNLSDKLSYSNVQLILNEVLVLFQDYEVQKKETSLVVYTRKEDLPYMVKVYLAARKVEGLSKNTTLVNYMLCLKDFFNSTTKEPGEITTNDVRLYLYTYSSRKSREVSNSTLENKRVIINAFFEWAANEGYITGNPAKQIKAIKCEIKKRSYLTQLELEKIRIACLDKRDKAIIEVLYSTGCRVSELCNLKKSDVNFETKEVTLFGKGNKERISYLNAKSEIALRQYLNSRSDTEEYVFVSKRKPNKQLHKCGIENIVNKIAIRTDVSKSKNITPHIFRHSMASNAIQTGAQIVDISKILGHVNIDTTMIYVNTTDDQIKHAHMRHVV